MTLDRRTGFTALTASIVFDEFDVGGMQEITVSEAWNVKPLNALGNRSPVAFIPGFFMGDISVKRAFIEKDVLKDILFHHLRPTISDQNIGDVLLNNENIDSAKAMDSSLIRGSSQFSTALEQFEDTLETWEDLFFTLYFNIVIKDEKNREIMILQDCVLDTKRFSMSQSNIIIMEDLTFKYRRMRKKI